MKVRRRIKVEWYAWKNVYVLTFSVIERYRQGKRQTLYYDGALTKKQDYSLELAVVRMLRVRN